MIELPKEADGLLALAPDDFVDERKKLAVTLREAGRQDEASAVAAMKKPSRIVLAVNRAARDRPQAAKRAADAAEGLGRTQLAGTPAEYQALVEEMEDASGLLSEVAVANLSKGRRASEAMRRRVADHIRGALSAKETRRLLRRGALGQEVEPTGFDAFAGAHIPKARRRSGVRPSRVSDEAQRARGRALRAEISKAERLLDEAETRVRDATRERDDAISRLADLRGQRSSSGG